MKALTAAIVTKATGSNFLSAIGGRLRNGRAENGEQYPYCVFHLPVWLDPQSESVWGRDYDDIIMQFSIFSSLHSPTEAWTVHGYLTTLYDDCTLTISGQTLIRMERRSTAYIPEDHTVSGGLQRVHHVAVEYNIVTKL